MLGAQVCDVPVLLLVDNEVEIVECGEKLRSWTPPVVEFKGALLDLKGDAAGRHDDPGDATTSVSRTDLRVSKIWELGVPSLFVSKQWLLRSSSHEISQQGRDKSRRKWNSERQDGREVRGTEVRAQESRQSQGRLVWNEQRPNKNETMGKRQAKGRETGSASEKNSRGVAVACLGS